MASRVVVAAIMPELNIATWNEVASKNSMKFCTVHCSGMIVGG